MAKKPVRPTPPRTFAVARLLSPVQDLIRTESASGVVLLGAALIAFVWANSPWAERDFAILDLPVGVGFGAWGLEKPLILWVNDLLMAVFFPLIGLEIKRECVVGELAVWHRASLVVGALGGMVAGRGTHDATQSGSRAGEVYSGARNPDSGAHASGGTTMSVLPHAKATIRDPFGMSIGSP